jgi:hypothetical protein
MIPFVHMKSRTHNNSAVSYIQMVMTANCSQHKAMGDLESYKAPLMPLHTFSKAHGIYKCTIPAFLKTVPKQKLYANCVIME